MKTKNIKKILSTSTVISVFLMLSCNSNKVNTVASDISSPNAIDTMKLNIDFASVDTFKILYTANEESEVIVQNTDVKNQIGQILTQFVNDTAWNNSGIMVKMVAPDYMLVLHHSGKLVTDDTWISIWKELGKAKVENKWYLLPENKDYLFILLDKQKSVNR